MFSLIITIISIALVAALALATIYYGGAAFNRGSDGAKASQLINEGQQINGAVTMAKADAAAGGTALEDLADLTTASPAYLAQLPASFASSGAVTLASGVVTLTGQSHAVCQEVQKRATGSTTVPAAQPANQVYGCFGSDTTTNATNGTFFYKF